MTNSEDPDQSDMGLHSFVWPISPNLEFYGRQHFKIMQNIPREKYLDMVSEG